MSNLRRGYQRSAHNKKRRKSLNRKRLAVLDATPTGDELLDEALAIIAAAAKPRKLSRWISALASGKLRKRVAQGLAAQNVLRVEKKRFLWVIPYEAFLQQDASAKYWLKARLRGIALGGEPPEPRVVALLSLLRACCLLDLVFTKDALKGSRKRERAVSRRRPHWRPKTGAPTSGGSRKVPLGVG